MWDLLLTLDTKLLNARCQIDSLYERKRGDIIFDDGGIERMNNKENEKQRHWKMRTEMG